MFSRLWAALCRHLVQPDPHPDPLPAWVYQSDPPERYRLRTCPACGTVAVVGLAHVCRGSAVVTEDDGDPGAPT